MATALPDSFDTPAAAFRRAVDIVGSQSATARLIGLSQQAISERLARGLPCPSANGAVLKLEAATGISRHDLRPDLYPRDASLGATAELERVR